MNTFASQDNKIMGAVIARGAAQVQAELVEACRPLAARFGGVCDDPGKIKGMALPP